MYDWTRLTGDVVHQKCDNTKAAVLIFVRTLSTFFTDSCEYFRHGTLSLYAALNPRTGDVLGKTTARHTSAEFVDFLGKIVASQPEGREIHIVADNLSAHKTKNVFEFLQAHPTVRIHYTPTYSSWLNQVEIWFSKIGDVPTKVRKTPRDLAQTASTQRDTAFCGSQNQTAFKP